MCWSSGKDCRAVADAAAKLEGVAKVLLADAALYDHMLAEPVAALIVSLAPNYDAIVAPATTTGKNFMPRVAALLDVMQISDIIKVIVAPTRSSGLIYAGNAIQTVQVERRQEGHHGAHLDFPGDRRGRRPRRSKTVAPASDPALSTLRRRGAVQVRTARAHLRARSSSRAAAPCRTRENFTKYIEPVADKLGAAVGASRAAVDAGYAPNDWQVGQTGKVVAPELYIAVGISGAIQHLAGMKDSKVIVAINKDEEAPIFQVADYGLVADLYKALPELTEELAKVEG